MSEFTIARQAVAERGKRLEYFTVVWNSLEGLVAVIAGLAAGSISLVGFGLDSFIEVTSGATLLWRMSVDADVQSRERNERLSLRIVGMCFIVLAIYIAYEAVTDLIAQKPPEHSIPGIILACVSLIVMPILSRAKKKTMGLYEMKYSFLIGIALTFGSHGLAAQSVKADAKSQKTVVASFVEMETEGGRLIPEGWRKASAFFVRSSPFTPDAKIAVIEKNYSVWDAMVIPPHTISVTVEIRPVGQIDSALRYSPPTRRFYKTSRHFNLVQTNHRWEPGINGEPNKEVTVPMQWLIDEPNDTLMLNVSTAIRYVTERRDKTTDPVVRKNADLTLTKLKLQRD